MPVHSRQDKGKYYKQWGNHGARYYYNPSSARSERIALAMANRQAAAAYANGYRGS